MNHVVRKTVCFLSVILALTSFGQSIFLSGQDSLRNPITVGVPFLSFAADSRASAMGDVGVATSPDANSVHWNNAKLSFIDTDQGFAFSYSPWLGNIVDDMSLNYLTYYKKINSSQAFGATFRYFDLGEIALRDEFANPNGFENPSELAFDATYSRKLSKNMGIGGTFRFIWSNLTGNITGAPDAKAGTSVAIDLGWYYTKTLLFSGQNSEVSFGAHLSNIGQKITYSTDNNKNFIPGNLRFGSAFKTDLDPYNTITFAFDINKLLVPTPREGDTNKSLLGGTFQSFGDAPRGLTEEIEELSYSVGAEYWYRAIFATRVGYFSEHKNKGDRKYFTLGAGFRYQIFGLDFSYLIPKKQNHPLADTLRISLLFNLNKKASQDDI